MPPEHGELMEKNRRPHTPMAGRDSLSVRILDSVSLPEPGNPVAAIRPVIHQRVNRPQAIRQLSGHMPTPQAAAQSIAPHAVEARAAPESAGGSGSLAHVPGPEVGMEPALSTSAQGQIQYYTGTAEEACGAGGLAGGLASAMVPGWLEQVAAIAAAAASAATAAIQAQQQPKQQPWQQQRALAVHEHVQELRQHGSELGSQQWLIGQEVQRVGDKEAKTMLDHGASSRTADAELSVPPSTSCMAGNIAPSTAAAAVGTCNGPPQADAGLSGGSQELALCSIPMPANGLDWISTPGDASSDQFPELHAGAAAPSPPHHLMRQMPPSLLQPFTASVPSSELRADGSNMPGPGLPDTRSAAQAGSKPGYVELPMHIYQVSARSHVCCTPPPPAGVPPVVDRVSGTCRRSGHPALTLLLHAAGA